VDLIGAVALELVVGEFKLDGSVPASQTAEDLVSLGGWVIVLDFTLGLYLHLGLVFRRLWLFGGFLFLLVFFLLLFLLVRVVFSRLLTLLV
jgi:hypothetical protein